ncbi:MAG TPA: hypothetical protein VLI06_12375, partial [Solimonas sp.]|nr:hypothetical protein [Solimonas sp.]
MEDTRMRINKSIGGSILLLAVTLLSGCSRSSDGDGAPRASSGGSTDTTTKEHPLLGGPRGGNVWANFCAGKGDEAVLPRDPRELLVPGVNEGRAVAFNAYWRSCDNVTARPQTCGELRAQSGLGRFVAHGQGEAGTPLSFAGGQENPSGLDAEAYNRLWEVWGLPGRPDNFDELVAQRHGSPLTPWRNPYPLPGENPNDPKLDGGSGQLPLAYTQIRKADGS